MLLISRCSLMHNHLAVQWIAHNYLPLLDYRRRCCELGRLEDFIISQITDHLFVGDHFVSTALCVPGPRPGMYVHQQHVQRDRWTLDVGRWTLYGYKRPAFGVWSDGWWSTAIFDLSSSLLISYFTALSLPLSLKDSEILKFCVITAECLYQSFFEEKHSLPAFSQRIPYK